MAEIDYSFIKEGARVRIKTKEQIEEMYPEGMPFNLTEPMWDLCGTTRIIDNVYEKSAFRGNDTEYPVIFKVTIQGWSWPEGALLHTLTPKGNEL